MSGLNLLQDSSPEELCHFDTDTVVTTALCKLDAYALRMLSTGLTLQISVIQVAVLPKSRRNHQGH